MLVKPYGRERAIRNQCPALKTVNGPTGVPGQVAQIPARTRTVRENKTEQGQVRLQLMVELLATLPMALASVLAAMHVLVRYEFESWCK